MSGLIIIKRSSLSVVIVQEETSWDFVFAVSVAITQCT